uniref:Uncharacterized protein n=1 Tax=Glossina pallidipes TaxID=7398 RepID=A0A1B0ACQ7_GLOPL
MMVTPEKPNSANCTVQALSTKHKLTIEVLQAQHTRRSSGPIKGDESCADAAVVTVCHYRWHGMEMIVVVALVAVVDVAAAPAVVVFGMAPSGLIRFCCVWAFTRCCGCDAEIVIVIVVDFQPEPAAALASVLKPFINILWDLYNLLFRIKKT